MIKFIKNIIINIMWQFLFDSISKLDFRRFINNLTVIFNTMSLRELLNLYKDIILDKITENRNYRLIYHQTAINARTILYQNHNKLFFSSFIFYIIVYRWFTLFKKIIIWPFKLGILSFFYSLFGIDLSWLLNLFDFFYN